MGRPRVVIVGAGFGGLECAKKLAGKPVDVLVLDRNNYHLFTPLLYQVASSLLNPGDIARPVRAILGGHRNIRFRQAEVTGVDFDARTVQTADGAALGFDYLVIATGSTTNFFGMQAMEQRAFGLKDLPEALELRNHILRCLESAALAPAGEAPAWLTFAVVGGGPTGVEYAGALSELMKGILKDEYPEIEPGEVRIILVEGKDEVLPPFPPDLGRAARKALQRKGVEVHTGVTVTGYTGDQVSLSDGETVEAKTVIWAAGVKPRGLEHPAFEHTRSGRIAVDEALRVRGLGGVFAIGDTAGAEKDGKEVPMLSAPAMQEGRHTARNILRAIDGEPLKPFRYRDRGSMATIGKNDAVAQIGRVHLRGVLGWVTWAVVHLYYIIGFRNRFSVMLSWGWNYVRSDRPVRIIARARGRGVEPTREEGG